MQVFVAGATGVIGRRLLPLLRAAGHAVTGTTRSAEKAQSLADAGVKPVVLDVFEADAVLEAMEDAMPEVIIHQLTDLPSDPDPREVAASLERNARLRIEGTRNLLRAAANVGVRRVVAQSIAFAYAPGGEPHQETDPLNLAAKGDQLVSVEGVVALERGVTGTPGIEGIVLRYGRLYGPGTWNDAPKGKAPLHADAAAHAALLALDHGQHGIYNIAEDDGEVSSHKARRELGFRPDFRLPSL
ncbi:MAG: NAD-dependent epimerase/dehydratase family protein [Xanthobacteraceae bacterium]